MIKTKGRLQNATQWLSLLFNYTGKVNSAWKLLQKQKQLSSVKLGPLKCFMVKSVTHITTQLIATQLCGDLSCILAICPTCQILTIYSVSQKNPPPTIFWNFFTKRFAILINVLHTYYTIISTLEYKFLFKYLQLWQSYAILSATT